MREYKLPANKNFLLALSGILFVLTIFSTYLKITDRNYVQIIGDAMMAITAFLYILLWFILIIDIIRNPIKNKIMWFIWMFMLGSVAFIVYLINRENHLRAGRRIKSI